MRDNIIYAVDLFCGGGGTSTGLLEACRIAGKKIVLLAINHWSVAIKTHKMNHPGVRHLEADLDSLNPMEIINTIPGKKIDILIASPECTYHSNARGDKPIEEQLRASAWCVPRWIEAGQPDEVLLEEVPEFKKWGPLDKKGKRIKSMAGITYDAYINAMRSLGYTVGDRIICTADYGDPTTRTRLFIRARKEKHGIIWPKTTHSEAGDHGLNKWIPAKDIIDWSLNGKSIFNRKKPLVPKTLKKIEAGLRKYGNDPFITIYKGKSKVRGINEPLPTLTTQPHLYLCQPFLLKYNGKGQNICSINYPLGTITTKDRFGLVEPRRFDILYRMLAPHELSAAMSFSKDYRFAGIKAEIIKQIGNAVPVRTAQALCQTLLAA